jgi:hypothetical protein
MVSIKNLGGDCMTREEIESGLNKYKIIAPLISDDPADVQRRRLCKEKGRRCAV